MVHVVERELLKATSFKPRKKYDDRQDYLSSVLNAVMKLTDEDFDNLSDDAATWANSAVEAHNAKDEIPDFDEVEASADDEAEDDEVEAEDDGDGDNADDAADDESDSDDDSDDPDEDDEAEEDDEPEDEDEAEEDEADEEPDEAPARSKKKQAGKAPKADKARPKAPAKTPSVKRRSPNADDVVLDKWGCMEGSKNAQALAMFEKGATAKEVKDKLGGTYYNILKRVVADGHKMEKDGAVIKITHKDDAGKKAAPKAGKKKK